MPVFDPRDELSHPPDWELIKNGPVVMFHARAALDEAEADLERLGYRLVRLDAGRWTEPGRWHADVATGLAFPAYYGRNLSAFDDCMSDVAAGEYGWDRADTGLVLVLDRFDWFVRADRQTAEAMLDVWVQQARYAALFGHRLLALLRSDDPDLRLGPVGAVTIEWNPREFLRSARIERD